MKPLFKNIESYQHYFAKNILKNWLLCEPSLTKYRIIKIVLERDFCMNGQVYFVPDLAIYDNCGIKAFFEVTKTNPISINKFNKMHEFSIAHNWNFDVYEIKAEWIMNQVRTPDKLKIIRLINF